MPSPARPKRLPVIPARNGDSAVGGNGSLSPGSPNAAATLPDSHRRLFRALTDNSWDRVAILDERGIIRYSSPSSTRIYWYSTEELVGRDAFEFVHRDDLRRTRRLFRQLLSRPGQSAHAEYRALRKDGQYIWMETTAHSLLHDPEIRGIVLNEREITDRKRVDAALLATLECGEAVLRATSERELLESICSAIVKMGGYRMAWVAFPDSGGGKKNLLPVARAGAGKDYVDKARVSWAAGEPRGRGPLGRAMRTRKPVACRDLAHDPRFAPWRAEALRRGYASVIALPLLWRSECLGALAIYSDQSAAFQREEAHLLKNLAGDIAYGLIALRTRAERERLQRELLEISEREQRRIAQDLHDGLCQQLLGAGFLADALQRRLAQRKDPEIAAVKRIAEAVRASASDARALSHGLQPVDSAPDSLMKALKDFAILTTRIFGTACRFLCPRPVLLREQSTATHLYRIAQEAVGNAIKHGGGTRVTIRLGHASRGHLSLSIRDNGAGVPAQAPAAKGMGLQIMRYRASMCGGTLDIRKSPSTGVLVTCRVPVSRREAAG
jgi:PAS domain S-box-containing protein